MTKILLIEDNEDIIDILSDVLVDNGYDVISLAGELALHEPEQIMPDMILLDEWIKKILMEVNGAAK